MPSEKSAPTPRAAVNVAGMTARMSGMCSASVKVRGLPSPPSTGAPSARLPRPKSAMPRTNANEIRKVTASIQNARAKFALQAPGMPMWTCVSAAASANAAAPNGMVP